MDERRAFFYPSQIFKGELRWGLKQRFAVIRFQNYTPVPDGIFDQPISGGGITNDTPPSYF
jgi:hypothetical protein